MTSETARILIVDDEADMTETIRRILARAGHDVAVETDSRQALERIQAEPPDLVHPRAALVSIASRG